MTPRLSMGYPWMSRRTLIGFLTILIFIPTTMKEAQATLKVSKSNYLTEAKKYLGVTGRPNVFTRWYAERVRDKGFEFGSWCAMFLSYVSYKVGLLDATGAYAYTPYWVQWFRKVGRWGSEPRVGAFVFFDWNGDGNPDHVGVVESWKPGLFYTIEGNKSDSVVRVLRDMKYVLGFGYPTYPVDLKPVPDPSPKPKQKTYTVKKGDSLASISRQMYGTPDRWADIYKKNRKVIGSDPDLIKPGQKLVIP